MRRSISINVRCNVDNYSSPYRSLELLFLSDYGSSTVEKLTSRARAESTAVSLFLVAFKHLPWEKIWISDTKLFNPFPDDKNPPNLPSGYRHRVYCPSGGPHLKIFYRTRSILAPVGRPDLLVTSIPFASQ